MARYDFGPGLVDFSPLGQIGDTLVKGFDAASKKRALANLGQGLDGSPEGYTKAAQSLLATGDVTGAQNFFALGEKARERVLTDNAYKSSPFSTAPATGAGTAPAGPLALLGGSAPSAPAPREFNRPVQVAETEEDTQRLEAEMERRGQIGYGNPNLPAGMRNNNPGNIKFVGLGQAPGVLGPSQNTDQGDPQAVFNSPEAGMSAAHSLALRKYQGGKRTANDLIAGQGGWTPGNTAAAANVARSMGLNPDDDLQLTNPQRAQAFLRALTAQEHGRAGASYPPEMIQSAVNGTGQQPAQAAQPPVQVAQAPAQPGAPVSDAPNQPAPAAANAQGFAIPQGQGSDIPRNDPYPNISTQQVLEVLRNPRSSAGDKEIAKTIYASRQAYSAENAPDKRELARLTTEKLRRDVEGVLTPEQEAQKVRLAQAGRTQINNNNTFDGKGENKFNEALGAAQAKRWNGYIEEGDVAQGRLADIQTLREASRRLGSQGSSANLKATVGPFAESLGIPVEGLPDIQLYESITNRLAPTLRAPGSGSTSDIEFKGFQRAIGPLSNNPAAREMILDTFEAASRNDIVRSGIASRLASGEINRGQAEKELRALPNPMEGFKKFREANPDLVGQALKEAARTASEQKSAGANSGLPKLSSPEEAAKLPKGTEFLDANGIRRRVP